MKEYLDGYNKEYCKRPKVIDRRREVNWRKFGIKGATVEKYNQLLEDQNYCCKICGRHVTEFKKNLHLDHNHKTGEIRGLLCGKCNLGLGNLDDNIGILEKAIKYLKGELI